MLASMSSTTSTSISPSDASTTSRSTPGGPPFPDLPGQRGLATVRQLLAAGWSTSALRHARRTTWQEPMPRVVAPHRGPVDRPTRLVAAGLWAGDRAVLSGGAALLCHGLTVRRGDRTTFVIPESSRAREHRAVRCIRSLRDVEVAGRLGAVRYVGAGRALADAAVYEVHAREDLEQLAIHVLQRGLATPEGLEQELWERPRARVAPLWKGLEAFVGGAWSRPEAVLRRVVEGAGGFPQLLTNCVLETSGGVVVGTPDGYFEDAGVAVQVHSRTYHQGIDDQGGDRWAATVEKDSDYVAAGVRVVGVAPWTLYSRPARFLSRLRKVVDLGLAGPRPAVRVVQGRSGPAGPA